MIPELFESAIAGIQKRGGAKLGDKTLLDALIPAAEAIKDAVESGKDKMEMFFAGAKAAEEGAKKKTPLSGKEIRFLRKNMGFSAVKLAETMGVDNTSISRWENGAQKMSATNDRMVRMLYRSMKGVGSRW